MHRCFSALCRAGFIKQIITLLEPECLFASFADLPEDRKCKSSTRLEKNICLKKWEVLKYSWVLQWCYTRSAGKIRGAFCIPFFSLRVFLPLNPRTLLSSPKRELPWLCSNFIVEWDMPECQQAQVQAKTLRRRKCHSQLRDRSMKVQELSVVGPKQSHVLKAALPGWVDCRDSELLGNANFFLLPIFIYYTFKTHWL